MAVQRQAAWNHGQALGVQRTSKWFKNKDSVGVIQDDLGSQLSIIAPT
jgi:hypothetical protein